MAAKKPTPRGAGGAKKGAKPARPSVVAITGAVGFLGRRLIRTLAEDEGIRRIVALDARHPVELATREGGYDSPAATLDAHQKVSAHQIDLTEAGTDQELAGIFQREEVDTVCHLAFLSNPTHNLEAAHELETIGTMYVLNAARAAGLSRVVSLSSTMCYGAHADNPAWLTEEHPLRGQPQSRFVRDKIDAEEQVADFAGQHDDVGCAIVRLGAMLGGSRTRNFWTRYFTRPVVPTVLGYDPLFQFLHAEDAVRGLATVVRSDVRGAYNLVGRGVLPLSQVLARLGRRAVPLPAGLGSGALRTLWSAQLLEMPPSFLDFLRWSWVADGRKLADATGFKPRHDISAVLADVRSEFA